MFMSQWFYDLWTVYILRKGGISGNQKKSNLHSSPNPLTPLQNILITQIYQNSLMESGSN